MEYETFKQQLIDNVKYMAGWSKVPRQMCDRVGSNIRNRNKQNPL